MTRAVDKSIIEQMAVAQALYKAVAEHVRTGDPDNLRGKLDAEFRQAYEDTHGMRYEVEVAGKPVGSYVFTRKEGKTRTSLAWDPDHEDEVVDWAYDNGFVMLDEGAILKHIEDTGELPPYCEVDVFEPRATLVPQLRIDVEKVKEALGEGLPSAVGGLLEESND